MSMLLIALLPILLTQNVTSQVSAPLVRVDVVVRNKNGPVSGLTKDDFTITDNDKPQRIVAFSTSATRDDAPPPSRGPMPPNVVSNFIDSAGNVPQHLTAILFDLMNSSSGQDEAIKQLVAHLRTIRETDRVGLFVLGFEPHAIQDFTGDPNALRRAAERLKELDEARIEVTTQAQLSTLLAPPPIKNADGSVTYIGTPGLASKVSVPSAADRASATADALEGVARHLSGFPGRKSLVWIATASPFTSSPSSKADASSSLGRATRALYDADVVVYPVGHPGMLDSISYRINELSQAVATAIEDSHINYTLHFLPTDQKFDGKLHQLKVNAKSKGEGISIGHTPAYFATSKTMSEKDRKALLNDVLSGDINSSEIGLLVSAEPDASMPGSFNVTISVDAAHLDFQRKGDRRVGQLTLAMRVGSSKSQGPQLGTVPISFTDEQFQNASKRGFVIRQTVQADSANDRVRIVVQDQSTGLAGAVWLPLRTN